jgi:carboxylesterase type B
LNSKEIVHVAINYRLNLFGFLSSKELQQESKNNNQSAGNLGELSLLRLKPAKALIQAQDCGISD